MRRVRFTRNVPNACLRMNRTRRIKWLDYHNLLGIVTLAWVIVVGATGVINTLATPIFDLWKAEALADLTAPYPHRNVPLPAAMSSLDQAVAQAVDAAPDMTLQFVAFPGGDFSTDFHYAVFLHGDTALTEHLITPALIDAETGAFAGMREMPWYTQALSLSKPLHFGDYGGLALKLLWAILDLAAIGVLATGLYLWAARVRRPKPRHLSETTLAAREPAQ